MIPPQPSQGDLKLESLTRQEIKKIQKSMKRPEFMGLLNQYMIEISDPKNKAEYDQYLKQMEKEGQLPKHMKLVKLKPVFCFRTNIVSERNKKHQMKFFVNMCSSEFIDKPTCQMAPAQSGGGYNWKIPNSLGKIRYDQDKHKSPCQVIDCGFHPDTFVFANQNEAFQRMIISIALEGAEKQLGQRKQTLSRDYIILKKLICKGQNGEPALLPIRFIDGKAYNKGQGPAQQQRNTEGKQTKIQRQLNEQKQKYNAQKNKNKNKQQDKDAEEQKQQDLQDNKKPLIQDLQKGIQAPKFTSIYTYLTDYSQFIEGMASSKKRTLPNSFTVEFKVPRMENISEANTLQINDKKIVLSVQDKYFIDISFEDMKVKNYPLKYSDAKAKFDKKKKTLRIQIPVDIASIPEQQLNQINEPQKKQEQKLVQNEVWKNKILQIPEQENTQKFLAKQEVEETKQKKNKKLIEQIDEDDYVEQPKQKQEQKQSNQLEEIQQTQQKNEIELKQFHISQYYEPKIDRIIEKTAVPNQLNFLFKQNQRSVVIMVYMRNYSDSQIKVGFKQQKAEFILLWLTHTFSALHLSLQSQYISKVKKVEVMKLVGYYAIIIHKSNQGEGWGQSCLKNLFKQDEGKTLQYFEEKIEVIKRESEQKRNQKKIQEQQKALQIKQKQEVTQKQQKNKEKAVQKIEEKQQRPVQNEIDDKIIRQKDINSHSNLNSNNLFQKLPIQFLKFQVPFIDTLN